ncbi:L-aminoadipate-semialdehyde dehydrogenase-phosphopantetheinyl transferase-like protein [Dinothrombium tinctorium]|uniref:L-aminoadipate-semialdehyde dehydrogenase-phosphopantetheinyl transferase n=1 Tax=Dinothrombium tinctorium TaxID=1965070 RepID=A0A3S3NWS1_9ACAR|nr:L-aminoadipate-semialdehyde dehydrogenase-phosphopantetheinyl transferase-like protein [Dinothrombium tinctorium]RWS07743.1 L-aminoadipate-semialdehyde dehydrogenase-phosphopantetheinyl transferase-like protein [Dinothrombium tinctorium]
MIRSKMSASIRWSFDTSKWSPNREQLLSAFSCLQRDEIERVQRFVYRRDLKQALIGRLMIRKCLSQSLQLPYDKLSLTRSESGKPILASSSDLPFDFNVSHSGNFVVLAADERSKIGVDVMDFKYDRRKDLRDFFKTMNRQFSESEWKYIRSDGLSDQQMYFRFIRLWCLKESFVKAEGIGITFDLRRISFHCKTLELNESSMITDSEIQVDNKILNNWIFEESLLDSNHCVTVAYESDESKAASDYESKLFKQLTFDELMESAVPQNSPDSSIWDSYATKSEKAF